MSKKLVLSLVVAVFAVGAVVLVLAKNKHSESSMEVAESPSEVTFHKELDKKTEVFLAERASKDDSEQVKKKLFTQFVDGPLIESEFAALHSMLDAQIAKIETLEIPQEKRNVLAQAFKNVFDAGAIYDSYLKNLYEQFSADELKELNEVYSNAGVSKTVAAMQHLRTKEGQSEFADYLKDLPNKPLSDQRKEQLTKFDEVTGMTANSAKLVNQVMGLMHDAIGPTSKNMTEEQKKAQEADKKMLEDYMTTKVHEGVMLTLAKAHDGISDQEMAEILTLRSKPSAIKEGKVRIDNITQFISSAKAKQSYETIMNTTPN